MHDDTSHARRWLVIADETCGASLRGLATRHGWPVIERVDRTEAARVVVALDVASVAMEAPGSGRSLPEAAVHLNRLDTVRRIVCIASRLTPELERRAAGLGVQVFESVDAFEAWLGLSGARGARGGLVGGGASCASGRV